MSAKKTEPIVGLYNKTREELSRTGDSWICIMPTNKRNSDENIKAGQDEWIPDPTRPLRVLVVQNRVKTWLSGLDFKIILDLYHANKAAIDQNLQIVEALTRKKAEALLSLFEE